MTRDEKIDTLTERLRLEGNEEMAEALESLRGELRRTAYERDSLRMERDGLE